MKSQPQSCANCVYGRRPDEAFDGICHFYPDQKWVAPDYWCAKWRALTDKLRGSD